jgi:hypothetical protein
MAEKQKREGCDGGAGPSSATEDGE